ncbi:hypothetical protein [Komagataeibacter europaeus]|uniref:hypothetical protein n=1 Tax=Komagataeibacter europaeus TaxID=33995 RepID=UPI0012DC7212|nr:hypothetical protein [Komagataeibacter europaeus]
METKLSTRSLMTRCALKLINESLVPDSISKLGGRANIWRINDTLDSDQDGALISVRTSMNNTIAFKHTVHGWETLDDVKFVASVSIDATTSPATITARLIDADIVKSAFNRALEGRQKAGVATRAC